MLIAYQKEATMKLEQLPDGNRSKTGFSPPTHRSNCLIRMPFLAQAY